MFSYYSTWRIGQATRLKPRDEHGMIWNTAQAITRTRDDMGHGYLLLVGVGHHRQHRRAVGRLLHRDAGFCLLELRRREWSSLQHFMSFGIFIMVPCKPPFRAKRYGFAHRLRPTFRAQTAHGDGCGGLGSEMEVVVSNGNA